MIIPLDKIQETKTIMEQRENFSESAKRGLGLIEIIDSLRKEILKLKQSSRFKLVMELGHENLKLHAQVKELQQENEQLRIVEQSYEAYKSAT